MDRMGASPALANLTRVLVLATIGAIVAATLAFLQGLWAAVGIAVLIFVTAFASGALLGFLFGLPRVLSRENGAPSASPATPPTSARDERLPSAPSRAQSLQSNTNLERISDWLTTMIVGATLVELHRVNDLLLRFRDFLTTDAKVFGVCAVAGPCGGLNAGVLPAVGPVTLIFGVLTGFLYMYLNTRLILIRQFAQIESFLAGAEDPLPPVESAQVREALVDGERPQKFLGAIFGQGALTVRDAIESMRAALYRDNGYREVLQIGTALNNTAAVRRADYWFLLAAAFGQEYAAAKAEGDEDRMASARDNALDCVARTLALDSGYRTALLGLTDPKAYDNDLAELAKDARELRRILGQA